MDKELMDYIIKKSDKILQIPWEMLTFATERGNETTVNSLRTKILE